MAVELAGRPVALPETGVDLPPLSPPAWSTAASLMLVPGTTSRWCELLGHVSITITSDACGHLIGTIALDAATGTANLIADTVQTRRGARLTLLS